MHVLLVNLGKLLISGEKREGLVHGWSIGSVHKRIPITSLGFLHVMFALGINSSRYGAWWPRFDGHKPIT